MNINQQIDLMWEEYWRTKEEEKNYELKNKEDDLENMLCQMNGEAPFYKITNVAFNHILLKETNSFVVYVDSYSNNYYVRNIPIIIDNGLTRPEEYVKKIKM